MFMQTTSLWGNKKMMLLFYKAVLESIVLGIIYGMVWEPNYTA